MTPYDFLAPPRLARDQSRLLEVSLETFARQWTTQLSSRLNCHTSVTFTGMRQQNYDLFANSLDAPIMLSIFTADDFGTGVLAVPVACALDHLDHALGGTGGEQPARSLTDIEVSITLSMVERALGTSKYAFAAFLPEDFVVDVVKQDPQLMQTNRANDIVVLISFDMVLGEVTHEIIMMLPLGPLQDRLKEATTMSEVRSAEDERRAKIAHDMLSASLPTVPLDVCLRLTPVTVAPQEVLDLRVGDLVRFPHARSRPLEVAASNQVVARGVPTNAGRRRAALIVSTEEMGL